MRVPHGPGIEAGIAGEASEIPSLREEGGEALSPELIPAQLFPPIMI